MELNLYDLNKNFIMDDLEKRGPQGRTRISLSEEWEIRWWTKEFDCTEQELRNAVDTAGNSVDAVRKYLSDK